MDKGKSQILDALRGGTLHLEGQFVYGSNYTFMVECRYQGETLKAVYKPVRGERPLWDFPNQTLARREVAAYVVSEGLGWGLVPPTVFRTDESVMGPGSAQLFIEHDPEYHYFNFEERDQARLPEVMLFDLLINNADRKAGHLLVGPQGRLWLIDHGLCFHVEEKLRTVVWDHAGDPIPEALLANLEEFLPQLDPNKNLHEGLAPLLLPEEIDALQDRAAALLTAGTFPLPPEDRRAYPWPLV
jgi:uncharacterized repeat protein (TIGR03843 family)